MPITFHTADVKFSLRSRNALKNFIEKQISQSSDFQISKFPNFRINISFIFCSDEYLLNINRQFLNHDYYTDIITFPLTNTKEHIEAEIYISIDRVKENSLKFKGKSNPLSPASSPFDLELHRVMFHGVLHLLGYKDKTKTNRLKMRKMEDEWLKQFLVYSL